MLHVIWCTISNNIVSVCVSHVDRVEIEFGSSKLLSFKYSSVIAVAIGTNPPYLAFTTKTPPPTLVCSSTSG